jgi:P27 family predicted phage terminase small subunit
MRGPAKKPQAIKRAAGTYRNDRDGKGLELPAQKPKTPEHLTDISRQTFDRLATRLEKLGVVSDLDEMSLEMLAEAWEDYKAARSIIKKLGPTYESETATGTIRRPNPEVAIMQEAWNRVFKLVQHFGLTPSSRARVGKSEEIEDIDDLLA